MRFDAQEAARAALAAALQDAAVRVTVPKPRPPLFVLVRRDGGHIDADGHRDIAGIGVQCWAPTEAEAYGLAARASAAVLAMERSPGVAKAVEEAFYSDPDPEDKSPRWYGSYTLTTYETYS